eukprot:3570063-Amphidinium_carterae.1
MSIATGAALLRGCTLPTTDLRQPNARWRSERSFRSLGYSSHCVCLEGRLPLPDPHTKLALRTTSAMSASYQTRPKVTQKSESIPCMRRGAASDRATHRMPAP